MVTDAPREVAKALSAVGIKPAMALATAVRQERLIREMAASKIAFEAGKPFSWRALAEAIARPAKPGEKKRR